MPEQLPLAIVTGTDKTLDSLYQRATDAALFAELNRVLVGDSAGAFLWGGVTGKSHILQAYCAAAREGALYLPLDEWVAYPPAAALEGAEHAPLLAFDNVEAIESVPAWQEALFHVFNRRQVAGLSMLFAGHSGPQHLPSILPDLRSRLASVAVFHLQQWSESELADLLQFLAKQRGFELSADVVRYILARAPRSLETMVELIERFDRESLARGRAVTVRFVAELGILPRQ